MPALAAQDDVGAEFYGSDFNARSTNWAAKNFPELRISRNDLLPPLPFPDHFFDFLYCRSVFTHLSEDAHFEWIHELTRVVKPGGVISISTQGVEHRSRLNTDEQRRFDGGELVLRTAAAEGKLMYSAFHPREFVRERLLAGLSILTHHAPPNAQEVWVVRSHHA
jgi:ubiquinone/menaquinone biosynthesis C-methylase UbiE